MNNIFDRHTYPVCDPQRRTWREAAWVVLACLWVVVLLGWGHSIDDQGELRDAEAISARAFEAGRMEAKREMADSVRAAYQQGQRQAVASFAEGAGAEQLGQLCSAWWFDTKLSKAALRSRMCGGARP